MLVKMSSDLFPLYFSIVFLNKSLISLASPSTGRIFHPFFTVILELKIFEIFAPIILFAMFLMFLFELNREDNNNAKLDFPAPYGPIHVNADCLVEDMFSAIVDNATWKEFGHIKLFRSSISSKS